MRKSQTAILSAAILAASLAISAWSMQSTADLNISTELKAEKIKNICRREPRAAAIFDKVQSNIDKFKANSSTVRQGQKLEAELLRIQMLGSGETEARLKEDLNLLEAAAGQLKTPTKDELAPLQSRYQKLVSDMDDAVLVKDFDRLLKKHDRFIRYTSLGLWDKDRISSELDSMSEMAASAPDLPFGKSEQLKGLQHRRLAAVSKLVYLGSTPHEEQFLSPERRSLSVLEESQGSRANIESADLVIQNPDGTLIDLTTANNPAYGMPFSPPLSLWMKTRMLENRIPAITLHLADNKNAEKLLDSNPGTTFNTTPLYTLPDILSGKLDTYFKQLAGTIKENKQPVLIGLFDEFDGDLAASAFGADGRTPFYMFDAKIGKLPPDQAKAEAQKKNEKGGFSQLKNLPAELSNQYGDSNIPDGPERVRDAWKHLHQILAAADNAALYSTATAYHGNTSAYKFPEAANSGTQTWNNLDFYFPGDAVLDWIGIQAVGSDPAANPKGANITQAVGDFLDQVASSNWRNTPIMFTQVAPGTAINPDGEPGWIVSTFKNLIPNTANVSIVLLDIPQHLTLWSKDAASTFRTNVSSNQYYKWPLRFKILNEQK